MSTSLSAVHRTLLEVVSGIAPAVIAERGYWSATRPQELDALGFAPYQRACVPCLVIPQYNHAGIVAVHQIRPDTPRVDKDGKARKYEFPTGARLIVSIPPRVLKYLGDPTVDLIITEGDRKADAAVSRGACCVSIAGVWNWVGTNLRGGKTALPDFRSIALNGRTVYLAFDSDAVTKPAVVDAEAALGAFLADHGAQVMLMRIPAGGDSHATN